MDQTTMPARRSASTGFHSAFSARRGTPLKIALFALVGWNNYGNDGSFEVMLHFLRRSLPEADLQVICVDPEEIERRYGLPAIPIRWRGFDRGWQRRCDRLSLGLLSKLGNVAHAIRQVGQFDFVIVPGTGVMCDYRASPFGLPYWIFRWCTSAKFRGVRLLMVSIGAGPIQRPLSRWMFKRAARSAEYLSFRDQYSKNFLAGIGLATKAMPVFPDLVFKLPPSRTKPKAKGADNLTVGVGVMWYNGWQGHQRNDTAVYDTYLRELTRFVVWLLQGGYHVRLLVGEVTDNQTVADLNRLVLAQCGKLPDGAHSNSPAPQSLSDVMAQVAETDIVVASRFHNVIAALKQGRPTISISYTPKHDELMQDMGLDAFCQPIEQLDADVLVQQFQDLVRAREGISQRIRDKVREYGERLAEQDKILLELLH